MSQSKYLHHSSWVGLDTRVVVDRSSLSAAKEHFPFSHIFSVSLLLCASFLWVISLQHEDVHRMNDLGMISTFPPLIFVALALMIISFGLCLHHPRMREGLLFLHIALLIFMLFGIQNIVEDVPRYSVIYRHAGYAEYIMRTGTVDPTLDAYFNWPGFFILSALLNTLAGYHDLLAYAGWAPVFYNMIYLGPLYMLFASVTTNKRLVWLGLWFFVLTNWIGQDYFSPQGLAFFFYLVIIAILLKWFKPVSTSKTRILLLRLSRFSRIATLFCAWLTAPAPFQTPSHLWQRWALLIVLLTIFAFVVFSHPLTPFFTLTAVCALVVFNRGVPRWLPLAMGLMTAAWIFFMTSAFLAGHSSMVVGNVGQLGGAVSTTVTSRVQGNAAHAFIAIMRVIMTAVIWLLALAGTIRRWHQGHADITFILLALAPFPLLATQQYGGEMFLRIYLFSLPFMAFFAAGLFYRSGQISSFGSQRWLTLATTCTSLLLLAGFLFTRYGNERMDYVTTAERVGIQYMYDHAQPNSLFLGGWNDTPWLYQNYERYVNNSYSMADVLPDAVVHHDAPAVVQFIKAQHYTHAYIIITIAQEAQAESLSGLPIDVLPHLETALAQSGDFVLTYSNTDVQIYAFVDTARAGKQNISSIESRGAGSSLLSSIESRGAGSSLPGTGVSPVPLLSSQDAEGGKQKKPLRAFQKPYGRKQQ